MVDGTIKMYSIALGAVSSITKLAFKLIKKLLAFFLSKLHKVKDFGKNTNNAKCIFCDYADLRCRAHPLRVPESASRRDATVWRLRKKRTTLSRRHVMTSLQAE